MGDRVAVMQAGLLQRATDAKLSGGTHPWSEIIKVIHVRAVDDVSQAAGLGKIYKTRVKLRLAKEATLMRIVCIARIGELGGIEKHVFSANLARD